MFSYIKLTAIGDLSGWDVAAVTNHTNFCTASGVIHPWSWQALSTCKKRAFEKRVQSMNQTTDAKGCGGVSRAQFSQRRKQPGGLFAKARTV